jgi:hypothetical protein
MAAVTIGCAATWGRRVRCGTNLDDAGGANAAIDVDRLAEIVGDGQALELLAVGAMVEHEVVDQTWFEAHGACERSRSGDALPRLLASAQPRARPSRPCGPGSSTSIAPRRTACRPAAPRDHASICNLLHATCRRFAGTLTSFLRRLPHQ